MSGLRALALAAALSATAGLGACGFTPLYAETGVAQGLSRIAISAPDSRFGFVLRGQLTTTDAAGGQETVHAHDLFYWPPGHNVRVDDDAEIIMFSPQHEHSRVIEHMLAKVSG